MRRSKCIAHSVQAFSSRRTRNAFAESLRYAIEPIHEAQLLTYMKLGQWRLGLLINFNVAVLALGVRRLIL